MRSIRFSTGLVTIGLLLAVGCEHRNKKDEPRSEDPRPVAKDKGGGMSKTPEQPATPAGKACDPNVRPPTAADLAEYTKDIPGDGKLVATIDTNMGTIHCELFGDKAPMTVANFVGLAMGKKSWTDPSSGQVSCKPFFDGLIFHRVIPEFMIQGGDPLGEGRGGPGYNFGDETQTDLKMQPGVLAMANAGPGTNGSQFFITETGPSWLNGKHTIFGQCKEIDLVKQIARVPQNDQNKPNSPINMTKVTISKMTSW